MGRQGHAAGLDVGGTKIAGQIFDDAWNIIEAREVLTPTESYASLLNVIVGEINWLHIAGGGVQVPIGIGLPGIVDPQNDAVLTANLPASGRPLWRDLGERLSGFQPVIMNDCRAFALSEAVLGAGRGHDMVVGLVIGTGLAGGLVYRGNLIEGFNGAAVGVESMHVTDRRASVVEVNFEVLFQRAPVKRSELLRKLQRI